MVLGDAGELAREKRAVAKLAPLEYGWQQAYRTARGTFADGFLPKLAEAVSL